MPWGALTIKVDFDAPSRKQKANKQEVLIADPYLFLTPALTEMPHLTILLFEQCFRRRISSLLAGAQRLLSEIPLQHLQQLTIGECEVSVTAQALLPVLEKDAFPRLQSHSQWRLRCCATSPCRHHLPHPPPLLPLPPKGLVRGVSSGRYRGSF